MSRYYPMLRMMVGASCILALVALFFVPAFAPWLLRFEHATADWRTALLSDRVDAAHPRIAVVAISDTTLQNYATSPIDRGLLARLVAAIDAAKPAAIAVDILFLKRTEPQKDAALAEALRAARAPVVLGAIDERGDLQPFQREFQKAYLAEIARPAGYLNLRHERDDVVRYRASAHPGSAYPVSFTRLVARAGGAEVDDAGRPIAWLRAASDGVTPFLTVAAHDLIAGENGLAAEKAAANAAPLAGRIVFVGGDFPIRDRHRTPLTAVTGEHMGGVYIHANMLADLMSPKRQITELSPSAIRNLLAMLALSAFVLGWLLWQSSVVHLVAWSFATAALLGIDAFVYKEFRLLLPFTLALCAWFLGVTGGRAARYFVHWISERRRIAT